MKFEELQNGCRLNQAGIYRRFAWKIILLTRYWAQNIETLEHLHTDFFECQRARMGASQFERNILTWQGNSKINESGAGLYFLRNIFQNLSNEECLFWRFNLSNHVCHVEETYSKSKQSMESLTLGINRTTLRLHCQAYIDMRMNAPDDSVIAFRKCKQWVCYIHTYNCALQSYQNVQDTNRRDLYLDYLLLLLN